MARTVMITDAEPDRFGIRVTDPTGRVGWIAGPDGDYLLFDSQSDAERALRKMMRDHRYSWNCTAEAVRFTK